MCWVLYLGLPDFAEVARLYLDGTAVDKALDLTALDLPDRSVDVLLCSHVLEHIVDDRKAMAEICRVLRDEGWALVNVPSDPRRDSTYEDWSITTSEERLKAFGQQDHVRIYGSQDFMSRLRDAGLTVIRDPVTFSEADRRRYLLDGDAGWDHSYLCRRHDR